MKNENFRKAVLQYGEMYIAELTKQLLLNNKKASGELIDSLDYKLIDTVDGILIDILASDYLKVVDKGLKPCRFPNVKKIIKWVDVRNIKPKNKKFKTNEDVGWAIAKSIDRKGIKPTNVLRKAKASLLANKKALATVVDAAEVDVKDLIKKSLKNFNNK